MSYMAVGSRQILFADTYAPALSRDTGTDVAALQDNRPEQTGRTAERTPAESPARPSDVGNQVDVSA